ncbi:lectin like domain-containing protein [Eubacterium sp.]|uniref:lectin like domain-containing protein n=1 Tax=Eubacterium sp. TaxID=142586 RepID=UPI002FCC03BC
MQKQWLLRGMVTAVVSVGLLLGNSAVFAESWEFSDRIASLQEVDRVWNDYVQQHIDRDMDEPEAYSEANAALPETYDLRTLGLSTGVKNQSPLSDCYAFGTIASVESNYLKQTGKVPDFSEKQLAYFAKHARPENLNQGGEGINSLKKDGTVDETGAGLEWGVATLAIGQLSNGEGVVNSSSVPHTADDGTLEATHLWTVSEDFRNISEAWLTEAEILSSPANYSTGIYRYDAQATQNIKTSLMENGALSVYMGVYDAKSEADARSVWNETTGAYYSKPDTAPNHVVTIIGWDDNFSLDNFSTGNQPEGSGAWLIKNSWGEKPSGINFLNAVPNDKGDKDYGYFWMSYYDKSIMAPVSHTVDPGADDHDNLVQYDYLNIRNYDSIVKGITQQILKEKGMTAGQSVANVFTAADYETLSVISVMTPEPKYQGEIQIYRNCTPEKIEGKTPDVTLNTGVFENAGFHTYDLGEQAINLRPNESYTIVQTITGGKDQSYLPVELGSQPKSLTGGPTGSTAVCNPGESYVQTTEGWVDLAQIGEVAVQNESATMTLTVGNAMIKAYTQNREATTAELVMAQIDALGEITRLDQEPQVLAARAAYEALDETEKTQVENIALLVAAEKKIVELKAAQAQSSETKAADRNNTTTGVMENATGLWIGSGLLFIALVIGGWYAKKRMMP